jgi:hypothetical protein
MKVLFIFIISFNKLFAQDYLNIKLKNLSNVDSIYVDSFNFYKISNLNINNFLGDTNSVIMEYSTWCRGLNDRKSLIDSIIKINSNSKIYLITSDLSTSVKENIDYLRDNKLYYNILYLDYHIYKEGNWGIKFANFISSISPNITRDFFRRINTSRFYLKKENNRIVFKGISTKSF